MNQLTSDGRSVGSGQRPKTWMPCLLAAVMLVTTASVSGEIYRWDNGQLIPGTQGIWPAPGVQLNNRGLAYAALEGADLRGANLQNTNLSNAHLDGAILGLAQLAEANITGTRFVGTTWQVPGFTKEQFYTTSSYQRKNLRGIQLWSENLGGWDFSEQDLTGAQMPSSNLAGADLTRALITGANLGGTTSFGLTKEQFYSTTSFQRKNLTGVGLWANDLTGWDFIDQDLRNASFAGSTLRNARLDGANITGVNFAQTTSHGFTREQLYSTASYQSQQLMGTQFDGNDLTGWDFSHQDLAAADFRAVNLSNGNLAGANLAGAYFAPTVAGDRIFRSNVTHADLSGAQLHNASFVNDSNLIGVEFGTEGLESATYTSATVYNQWTRFPQGFDPAAMGMTFEMSPPGDFDGQTGLTAMDVEFLSRRIRDSSFLNWQFAMFDLNDDASIDHDDLRVWVVDLKRTWFGDANLDGEFSSADLIDVLQSGQYEDAIRGNSAWRTGDWDADGDFTTSDLVVAFQDGGYERGPRRIAETVPEPAAIALGLLGAVCVIFNYRRVADTVRC